MFHSCFTTYCQVPNDHGLPFAKNARWVTNSLRRDEQSFALNPHHLQAVKMGAAAVDDWRSEHPADRLDLSGADLTGMNFSGWNLSRVILDNADLTGSSLKGADLSEGWARRTKFVNADLSDAALFRTSLAGADLSDANLSNTNMYRCILRDAILNDGTNFNGAWTAKVIWPDTNQ